MCVRLWLFHWTIASLVPVMLQGVAAEIEFVLEDVYILPSTDTTTSIAVSATFDTGEVDTALLEWTNSHRRPKLDYYYVFPVSFQARSITFTLSWNPERTALERREAGGSITFSVLKEASPVASNTFVITVHWPPSNVRSPYIYETSAIEGGRAVLNCEAQEYYDDYGWPSGSIVWILNNTIFTVTSSTTVYLEPFSGAHFGTWKCYFNNTLGVGEESELWEIMDFGRLPGPAFISPLTATGLIGRDDHYDTLTLTCSTNDTGSPAGTVEWTWPFSFNAVFNALDGNTYFDGGSIDNTLHKFNLELREVSKERSGQYSCRYFNEVGYGEQSAEATLTILTEWPPSDVIKPRVIIGSLAVTGGKQVLYCSISKDEGVGYPQSSVVWMLNDTIYTVTNFQDTEDNDSVELNPFSDEHIGTWKCYFNNSLGVGLESEPIDLFYALVPGKPTIRITPEMPILIGATFYLECYLEVENRGLPITHDSNVFWDHDGVINFSYWGINVTVTNDDPFYDTGYHECYYSNDIDDGPKSDPVRIQFGWLPSTANLEVVVNGPNRTITLDSDVTLKCSTPDKGKPSGSVMWNRKNNSQEYDTDTIQLNPVSRDDNGTWQCYYKNKFGEGVMAAQHIIVQWHVSSFININGPPREINEGEIVILECNINEIGNPAAAIQWTKDGMNKTGESFRKQTLVLDPVTLDDKGDWSCYGYNEFSMSNIATYKLMVKPTVVQSSVELTLILAAIFGGLLIIIIIVVLACIICRRTNPIGNQSAEGTEDRLVIRRAQEDNIQLNKFHSGCSDPLYQIGPQQFSVARK